MEHDVVMVDVPMARPLRIESPGALDHVILLGNLHLSRLATARFRDEPSGIMWPSYPLAKIISAGCGGEEEGIGIVAAFPGCTY